VDYDDLTVFATDYSRTDCPCVIAHVAKTGQTVSYATGDDGDLKMGVDWPVNRFTDNLDGTVTDNLTGLMWLKDANCIATNYPDFDNDGTAEDGRITWQHSLDFVVGINDGTYAICGGGYNDWRLPNRKELQSLTDLGNYNPALPSGHPFSEVQSDFYGYWSSTTSTYADDNSNAWRVSMYNGYVTYYNKTQNRYVWPVRGGDYPPCPSAPVAKTGQTVSYATGDDGDLKKGVTWPVPRFTDNVDGTVTDNLTGLMWLKDANCIATNYPDFDNDGTAGDGAVTWQHSLDFVVGINDGTYATCGGGYSDWRLPNIKELQSLLDFSEVNPPLPSDHLFSDVQVFDYWSSTTRTNPDYTSWAWIFNTTSGYLIYSAKNNPIYYVWPVRGGQ
jgi:hypothetical protein